jgi:nitrogen fixation protein FixH
MSARKFTGWHMTGILVAFFGVVVSVNIFMARAAISTFGGTVVDNSYVASQEFNGWLDKAAAQKALGWTVTARLDVNRHVLVAAATAKAPLRNAVVDALVRHPLGRVPERALRFTRTEDGQWTSSAPLPAGRWIVHLTVRSGGEDYRQIEELL